MTGKRARTAPAGKSARHMSLAERKREVD